MENSNREMEEKDMSVEEVEVVEEVNGAEGDKTDGTKDWRESVYGNITMSVKTLDIVIGCMIGFIVLVLAVGAIKLFL